MAAATSRHDPMKNRPAASRAVRGAVFRSTYPAGRRDNHEIDDAKNIDAD